MKDTTDSEFDDSIERDGGVFIARRMRVDPLDEDEGRDIDLGEDRDPELWGAQAALVEEDAQNSIDLTGFEDADAARVMEAMGDEVADPLQDSPNGLSATGSPGGSDRGGFPERD